MTRQAASINRIRAARRAAGLCNCGAAREPGRYRCADCRAAAKAAAQKARDKLRDKPKRRRKRQ